jgi:hypothetical protein
MNLARVVVLRSDLTVRVSGLYIITLNAIHVFFRDELALVVHLAYRVQWFSEHVTVD